MSRKIVSALLGALALAPSIASAQPLPPIQKLAFTTITKTALGPQTARANQVIQSQQDYDAYFLGHAPSAPAVDFTQEDVLAVSMGNEPTTGYATEITSVEYIASGGGIGFVHYTETTPPTGSIQGQIVTHPAHVVSVAKKASAYVFVNDANAFTNVQLEIRSGSTGSDRTISVDPTGGVIIHGSTIHGKLPIVNGQASGLQLAALYDAFAAADVTTLPAFIPDPRMLIGARHVTLTSDTGGSSFTFDATLDYYGAVATRVKPLVEAIMAIDAALTAPPQTSFDKLLLATQGGFIAFHETITVSPSGTVTVDDTYVTSRPPQLWTGQATPAELAAVTQAFANADIATIPSTIQPSRFIPDIPSDHLSAGVAGTIYDVLIVRSGDYNGYDARLKPLVDSIRAIATRLKQSALGQIVSGVVAVDASGNVTIGRYAVPAGDPLTDIIASADGLTVTAHVSSTGVVSVTGTLAQDANLRRTPRANGHVLETLSAGDSIEVTGENRRGTYYKATAADGKSGYIYAYFVNIGQ